MPITLMQFVEKMEKKIHKMKKGETNTVQSTTWPCHEWPRQACRDDGSFALTSERPYLVMEKSWQGLLENFYDQGGLESIPL